MNSNCKRFITYLSVFVLCFVALHFNVKEKVFASNYISVYDFAEILGKGLNLKANENVDYIKQLIEVGIINNNDFSDYKKDITRGDVMLLINRADKYLHKSVIDIEFVKLVIQERISDIDKVKKEKRNDIAEAYIKGFLKGKSYELYSTKRVLMLKNRISYNDAINCIRLLRNKNDRVLISNDGQLIRTTNLPSNADSFEYILANYPNKFYEMKLMYDRQRPSLEHWDGYIKRISDPTMREVGRFTKPSNVVELIDNDGDLYGNKNDVIYDIIDNTKQYLETIFNVNYKTIGDGKEFKDKIANLYGLYKWNSYSMDTDIERYIKEMKDTKTIVECGSIDTDPTALYESDGDYYLRVHIRFKIVSTTVRNDIKDYLKRWTEHNSIIFDTGSVYLEGFKKNEWIDIIKDVKIELLNNKMYDLW